MSTPAVHPVPPTGPPRTPRAVWVCLVALAAVAVGSTTGLLSHAGGVSAPLAILAGGAAAGGAIQLGITVIRYATGDRD
jgi:hypothetical protein